MSLTSNGLFNPMNRFGFTKQQLLAYSPDYADRTKVDFYVPTRNDVYKLPQDELVPLLERWISQAPAQLRPNPQQVRSVVMLIKLRKDYAAFASLISRLEPMDAKTASLAHG